MFFINHSVNLGFWLSEKSSNSFRFFLQVEEFIALTDPKLSLFTGEEEMVESYEDRPQQKLTQFW